MPLMSNIRSTCPIGLRTLGPVIAFLALCGITPAGGSEVPAAGQALPAWREGHLEVHHINTGRGDAVFFIFPDGTAMLFDAGEIADGARPEGYIPPRRPDASRPAGEWIGRYIRARHPGAEPALDFAVMSHFHGDHIGGIADVAAIVPIRVLLDRAGPDCDATPAPGTQSYRRFVAEHVGKGMTWRRFEAGRDDQIVLRHKPEAYPQFHVRHLAVNTEAWTGRGHETRPRFAEGQAIPSEENTNSAALLLRYGPFAYYLGGDLQEPMEQAIAWVTGPVDVHVANHHGSQAHPFFLSVLRPRVHIVQVWAVIQPRPAVFERLFDPSIYPGPRDVFLTNGLWPGRAEHFLERYEERVARLIDDYHPDVGRRYVEHFMPKVAADQGHIVVCVEPAGRTYRVIVLGDTDESFTVRSVHGPYESRP